MPALPGTYTLTLAVGDQKFTQKLSLLKDPHSTGSEADIQAQTRVVSALWDELNAFGNTADFPPTTQQSAVQELLKQEGDKAIQDFQQFVSKDLAAFNAMLREHNIGNIYLKTQ